MLVVYALLTSSAEEVMSVCLDNSKSFGRILMNVFGGVIIIIIIIIVKRVLLKPR